MPAPGGNARRRRRHRPGGGHGEEGGGAERWLVTYADMLTLLLVLFIVLFSISVVNTSKFEQLKRSLASAFGAGQGQMLSGGTGLNDDGSNAGQQTVVGHDANGSSPMTQLQQDTGVSAQQPPAVQTDYSAAVKTEINNFAQIKRSINDSLQAQHMEGDVAFAIDSRGMVITVVTSDLLFGPNSATLSTDGTKLLGAVAPPLVKYPNDIEVDGYTNQDNVSTYPFVSGWDLSGSRAGMVAHFLQEHSIADQRLKAVGLNDQNPKFPASDKRSSKYNRRVEIVVLSTLPAAAGPELAAAGSAL
jgi:chemotaxis protein MotB